MRSNRCRSGPVGAHPGDFAKGALLERWLAQCGKTRATIAPAVPGGCAKQHSAFPPADSCRKVVGPMDLEFLVTCPYCGETVEISVEPDVRGSFVQDCEVCCNPWRVRVSGKGDDRSVDVARADGSE